MRIRFSPKYSTFILIAVSLHFSNSASSQFAIGIESGVSWSYMRISNENLPPNEYVRYITDFPLGVTISYQPTKKLNVCSGLKYNPKGFQQKNQYSQEFTEIRAGYLELPLNFRFLVGHTNVFWYLEPGFSYLYLISYQIFLHQYNLITETYIDEVENFNPIEINKNGGWHGYLLSLNNFQISAGTGMQVNLKRFLLSAGFSFEWGLNNFFVIHEGKKGFEAILNRSAVFNVRALYSIKTNQN